MSANTDKDQLIVDSAAMLKRNLQQRNNLSQDDLEYVVQAIDKLRDERLKECVATLIGWGDDERAEVETFCAIVLEVMKQTTPSKLREAARIVHIRSLTRELIEPLRRATE